MAFDNSSLKDYVEVKDRILEFYEKYPQGSIMSEIVTLTDKLVVVKATAYRNSDDKYPCVGHSQLEIPGRTPYTRGSEIENAETSAWGRALAAMGFKVKAGIASRSEIQNKAWAQASNAQASNAQAAQPTQSDPPITSTAEFKRLRAMMTEKVPEFATPSAKMDAETAQRRNEWITANIGREAGLTELTKEECLSLIRSLEI